MVEVLNQIQTAESQGDEIRRAARHQAKQLLEEAAAKGRKEAEAQAQTASAEAAAILKAAEEDAASRLGDFSAETKSICDDLADQAQARMEKAAAFIVERIVQSL